MKNALTAMVLMIFVAGCDLDATTANADENRSMCPALSKEVAAQRPNYNDFITAKPSVDYSLWKSQYAKYTEAENEFNTKFADEIAQVDSEWNKLRASQPASKTRFYDLFPVEGFQELYAEVISACWTDVMGVDEYEKDNLCKKLDKTPDESQWDDIFNCAVDRSVAIVIEFE